MQMLSRPFHISLSTSHELRTFRRMLSSTPYATHRSLLFVHLLILHLQVTKKNDQMYALIAICVALCPTRLDDTIHASLREKYGEQFTKMQRGGSDALQIYEHLFMSACPKFISPIPPDFDNPENNVDPSKHHLQIFMADVRNSMLAPTLKSYLKLYTTMDLKKLAAFIEVDPEVLRTQLLVYKQRSRQTRWIEGGLLEGETINTSDLDFALQGVSLSTMSQKGSC